MNPFAYPDTIQPSTGAIYLACCGFVTKEELLQDLGDIPLLAMVHVSLVLNRRETV
ncbi:MAG: hypothetical protein OEM39_01975 [Acidimicrobiia bacterium]|nr:hypothetical protein [Acidimicrobiia bacterium]